MIVNGQQEYVICKLSPVEHVIWATTLADAGQKAKGFLESGETLISVKTRMQFESDKSNGRRF